MKSNVRWTNKSVLKLAEGQPDPVQTMESKARALVLQAIDLGWSGPPFDPIALAKLCGLKVDARGDIPDARLVPDDGNLRIEYNPTRPRGRLRFSIAHEIAHTLFPDCGAEVRNRLTVMKSGSDSWQMEVLCNIGAAEMLMPLGSFSEFASKQLEIDSVLELRKIYDVSIEACLIRFVKLSRLPGAAFCASMHDGEQYKVDYVIPTAGWKPPIGIGYVIPTESAVAEANAIGYTTKFNEEWNGAQLRVECVALAPYPGSMVPRVVGFILPRSKGEFRPLVIEEVHGDVLAPRGKGTKIIAHVVPNTNALWGGRGVAAAVRKRYPSSYLTFRHQTAESGRTPFLGEVITAEAEKDILIAHMVAQKGFGPSQVRRLNYEALSSCLSQVRNVAKERNATVHLPRVGTGHGGADWHIVQELLMEELARKGINFTVYALP